MRDCVCEHVQVCVCEKVQVCVFSQLPLGRRGLQLHLSLLLGKTRIHGYLHTQSGVNVDVGACFIHVCVCVCVYAMWEVMKFNLSFMVIASGFFL